MTHESLLSQLRDMEAPSREMDAEIAKHFGWTYEFDAEEEVECWRDPEGKARYLPKLTESVDAAIALTERVLPGRSIMMGWRQTSETRPWARVGLWPDPDATGATPAIALCLAALSALSAINRSNDA